jgi:hypothetical protein
MPGAMPEILPSPGFGTNMGEDFLSRSSVLQAWGAYRVLWPVIHQQLGVAPDLGNGKLTVIPRLLAGQKQIAGSDILVGTGHLDVQAARAGNGLSVTVDAAMLCRLTVGVVLPAGAKVASVTLDGRPIGAQRTATTSGDELAVKRRLGRTAHPGGHDHCAWARASTSSVVSGLFGWWLRQSGVRTLTNERPSSAT